MISLLFASDKRGVIGVDGKMPWHLPADLKYFQEKTLDQTMVMGRKTFESLGGPLFRRDHLVLTTNLNQPSHDRVWYFNESTHIFNLNRLNPDREFFIIGGAQVLNLFMPYADRVYRTLIDHKFAGDTVFRPWLTSNWTCTKYEKGIKDEKNPYDYYFETWGHK